MKQFWVCKLIKEADIDFSFCENNLPRCQTGYNFNVALLFYFWTVIFLLFFLNSFACLGNRSWVLYLTFLNFRWIFYSFDEYWTFLLAVVPERYSFITPYHAGSLQHISFMNARVDSVGSLTSLKYDVEQWHGAE